MDEENLQLPELSMAALRSAPGSRLPMSIKAPPPPHPVERGVSAPSKLEQIRQQYQEQLQRAKEKKLRDMYFHNPPPSNRALLRLTSNAENQQEGEGAAEDGRQYAFDDGGIGQGNVRDYFKQRRATDDPGSRKKNGYQPQNGYGNMYKQQQQQQRANVNKPPAGPQGYNGMGRDKSKPLAPISRDNSVASNNSTPRMNMNNTYTLDKDGKAVPFNAKAVRARKLAQQQQNGGSTHNNNNATAESDMDTGRTDRSNKAAKPPAGRPVAPTSGQKKKAQNFREWQDQQKRKREQLEQVNSEAGDPASDATQKQQQKQSDFQTWQQSMDQDRTNRLEKHRQSNPPAQQQNQEFDDPTPRKQLRNQKAAILQKQRAKKIEIAVESEEDEDEPDTNRTQGDLDLQEIRRQEAELHAQIEKQTRELEKIRLDRQKEQEEEQRKEEADRKKRAALAAKQKRLKQEEEEARRREEEQEEKIRRLEEINNNNQKIIAAHSDRSEPPTSHRTYSVKSREESPPSKYFPTKPVRPRSRKTSVSSVQGEQQQQMEQKNNWRNKQQSKPAPPKPAAARHAPEEDDDEPIPPKEDPTAFYLAAAEEAESEHVVLRACNNCGRKFAEERLAKHTKVCKTSTKKKRKVFDQKKMRLAGTEFANYDTTPSKKSPQKPKKSNWRTQHDNFIKTIRYAKAVTEAEENGTNMADLPPPPVSENPDYKQCPYCSRKFNEGAAERHIPRCKEAKSRPAPPPRARRK